MSLKLDELRKRLLNRTAPDLAVSESLHLSSSHGVSAREIAASEPPSATEPEIARQSGESTAKVPDSEGAERRPAEGGNSHVASAASESNAARETFSGEDPIRERVAPFRRPTPSAAKADPSGQYQLADAVAKVFEQTQAFRVRFNELARNLDKIERLGEDSARAFEPLRSFHGQLAQLAASFEPMRAFQLHLAQLADSFEPMKVLQDQLAELADSFQQHLEQLLRALDPAKDFRDRLLGLAHSFDEAIKLQADFGELYTAFRSSGPAAAGREGDALSAGAGPTH